MKIGGCESERRIMSASGVSQREADGCAVQRTVRGYRVNRGALLAALLAAACGRSGRTGRESRRRSPAGRADRFTENDCPLV